MTLGRCGGSGVWGVAFIFCLGMATLKCPGFFVGMVTLLDGEWGGGGVGEAGDSPQPQFGVGDMWRVYVECVLLVAGLQPYLA